MPRVSTLNRPAVIKCPNCGVEAEADPIQLQGRCSLICPYCVLPETLILGDNKLIEEIQIGDQSTGLYGLTEVQEVFKRPYNGSLIVIDACGLLPLKLTPEHPVLVAKAKRCFDRKRRNWSITFYDPEWKLAKDITTGKVWLGKPRDYLVIPRLKGDVNIKELNLKSFTTKRGLEVLTGMNRSAVLPLNEETAWLLGLYVAEGHSTPKEACYSFGKHEKGLIEKTINLWQKIGYACSTKNQKTSAIVTVQSRIISRALQSWCGHGAHNKHVPDFLLFHKDKDLLQSFLDGYISGDGCLFSRDGREKTIAVTCSRILAMQLQLLLARLGLMLNINEKKTQNSMIEGREIQSKENHYDIRFLSKRKHHYARVFNNFILTPVRAVTKEEYYGIVYNIGTGDDTYLASNAVIHNCGFHFYITPKVDGIAQVVEGARAELAE